MPPRLAKAETLRILMAMIASAASAGPAVLLFEDLHWADPTTCEALDLLVAGLGGIAAFVVATYRPEFNPALCRAAGRYPSAAHPPQRGTEPRPHPALLPAASRFPPTSCR